MNFQAALAAEASSVPTELHEVGTWTPAGGTAVEVFGIFTRVSDPTDIGDYIEADGVSAGFNVATAAVEGVKLDDALSVEETPLHDAYAYRVVGIEPTGRGRTVLVLGIM